MTGRKRWAFVVVAALWASACVTPGAVMNQNNAAIRILERGMTEQEVIDQIGPSPKGSIPNPFRTELYPVDDDVFKILFFYTNRTEADDNIKDDELTPVVFKNGRLDGWGWSYWENTAQQYNIRIRGI